MGAPGGRRAAELLRFELGAARAAAAEHESVAARQLASAGGCRLERLGRRCGREDWKDVLP